jgi:thioredoxin reductase
MELPDWTFDEMRNDTEFSKIKHEIKKPGRVTANEVRDYYQSYVKKKHLEKYMLNNATVLSVRKIKSEDGQNDSEQLWEVCGTICPFLNNTKLKYEFRYKCKYLVLAIGTTDIHNELGVPGEHLSFILRSIRELEEKIKKNLTKVRKHPLLVVGCGLSSADCILIAQKYRIKIIQVMRSSVYDTNNMVYPKLPKSDYPEYHWVYEKMLQSKKEQNMQTNDSIDSTYTNDNYVLYDEHTVRSFTSSRTCVLRSLVTDADKEFKISYACVLIGHSANLAFLQPSIRNNITAQPNQYITKDNPLNVDPYTLETIECKNLFGMGPIVGDNFVRYGTAGALSISNAIVKTKSSS